MASPRLRAALFGMSRSITRHGVVGAAVTLSLLGACGATTIVEMPAEIVTAGGACGSGGCESSQSSAVWNAGGTPVAAAPPIPPSWIVSFGSAGTLVGDQIFPGETPIGLGGIARAVDGPGPLAWSLDDLSTVPAAHGDPLDIGSNTSTILLADGVLASTRSAPSGGVDIVAYVTTAFGSDQTPTTTTHLAPVDPDMIVAIISFDGGVTFTQSVYVNEFHCNGLTSSVDQPSAAFDTTVFPPRLWVAWRWNAEARTVLGTYGACTQFFDIDPIAKTVLMPLPRPKPQEVQNLDRSPFQGIGGLVVQAQSGLVSIVYSNSDHHYDCPSSTNEMKWLSVSSSDQGKHWTSSSLIRDTNSFAPCLANGNVENYKRTFGFINDAVGDYYVALPTAQDTVQVFRSIDQGTTWSPPIHTLSGNVGSRIHPTIASDGPGRIALHYYTTDIATDTFLTPVFIGSSNVALDFWDIERSVGPSFPIDHWTGCAADTAGNLLQCRTLGDYLGMGFKPHGPIVRDEPPVFSYLPAWTAFSDNPISLLGSERVTATRVALQSE